MAVAPTPTTTQLTLPKLAKEQIQYLALEGGGGKGSAYPGALKALTELGILKYANGRQTGVKGIAGASAGAITALITACGFDHEEIQTILEIEHFDAFFEIPRPHYVPTVKGFVTREPDRPVKQTLPKDAYASVTKFVGFVLGKVINPGTSLSDIAVAVSLANDSVNAVGKYLGMDNVGILLAILGLFWSDLPPPARGALGGGLDRIAESLVDDYGVFVGEAPWKFLNKWCWIGYVRVTNPSWIASIPGWDAANDTQDPSTIKKHRVKLLSNAWGQDGRSFPLPKNQRALTFEEHYGVFGVKLAITGSELQSMKSHVFSATTTPKMAVPDAVRISMSLPAIFKPYKIAGDDATAVSQGCPVSLAGVWVDGGLFNNTPIHAFDKEPGDNPKTLAVRLGLEADDTFEIKDFWTLLHQWPFGLGVFGAGEAQMSMTVENYDDAIVLDPKPLGLLDFQPDPLTAGQVQQRAYTKVKGYFGEGT